MSKFRRAVRAGIALTCITQCSSTLNGLSLGAVVIPMTVFFRRLRLISMAPN
jgi:hypothetical protein